MFANLGSPSRHRRNESDATTPGSLGSPWSVMGECGPPKDSGAEPLEPIAIVGLSCRLAGAATNPSALWDMLLSGQTAWTSGPGDRFNMDAFRDASTKKAGTTNAGGGHFLQEDISKFDAALFGINPVEAMAMDPQHRLLLEIAYEAFENAGLTLEALVGSNTGVYVGQWTNDYHEIETRDTERTPFYLVLGTGPAMAANRVSYHFDLRGPSFTMDTGCSSGLVALHQAVLSLRAGETAQCFVGGVNLLLDPARFCYQGHVGMFSDAGRCFAFDSRADGYGRGEGCAGVVLKPLSAALRDGDHVRAVIRNSAVNQDGRTPGISVPSAAAQTEAILQAYRQAKLEPRADYVEAHGTGTRVGDPIEANAIAAAFTQNLPSQSRLPIGSAKGNVGHTESASGLVGLIKAVLMLENGVIPPQVNFEKANPEIPLDRLKLRIVRAAERMKLGRVSVNSFGYGGTNAHVIVDAAETVISSPRIAFGDQILGPLPTRECAPRVFFISAASETSCQMLCTNMARYLVAKHRDVVDHNEILSQLAHSLSRRTTHAHRVALVACSIDDLVTQLNTAATLPIPGRRSAMKRDGPRIAFVFSGQGAQYAEMGCELLQTHLAFARSIERARQRLVRLGCQWDLVRELRRPRAESRVNEPAISQPSTTAVQLALVDLLASFGVTPCAVAGHSSGEIAAAYAAGYISFDDAMAASYFRGKLTGDLLSSTGSKKLQTPGAMLAVGADPATVEERIRKLGDNHGRMRIACFNSPASVSVSGDAAAIDALKETLDVEGMFNRKLMTNGAAYHSHQMQLIEADYVASLHAAMAKAPLAAAKRSFQVRMFSSVTGSEMDARTAAALDGSYWARNLVSPVLFSQALTAMCEQAFNGQQIDTVVEVGPHSQLAGPVKQILKAGQTKGQIVYTNTLKRGTSASTSFLECLAFMNTQAGFPRLCDINNPGKNSGPTGFSIMADKPDQVMPLVDLPPYAFDHGRCFWHETRISKDFRHRQHVPHELLGTLSPDVNPTEPRWRRFLSLSESPWLRAHVVQGQIVFPAAGYISMAIQAARQQHMRGAGSRPAGAQRVRSIEFRNVSIGKALVLPEEGPDIEIVFSLRPQARTARESSAVWSEFRVFTVTGDDKWAEHCRGLVRTETDESPRGEDNVFMLGTTTKQLVAAGGRCTHQATSQRFYHLSRRSGLDWQHPFDNMTSIRTGPDGCVTAATNPTVGGALRGGMGGDVFHPALLDSCLFHGRFALSVLEKGAKSPLVPTFIRRLHVSNEALSQDGELVCTTESRSAGDYDVVVEQGGSGTGAVLAAEGIRMSTLPGDALLDQSMASNICHGTDLVTYVDAWTPEHRDQICKANLTSGDDGQNRRLDHIALHYIIHALKQANLADIPDGHRRNLHQWMQQMSLPLSSCSASDMFDQFNAAISSIENVDPMSEAILRLGPNLASVLTNEVDPLSLLANDGLLNRVYQADCFTRCATQISQFSHHLGRLSTALRVMEMGAGAKSTLVRMTAPILQALTGPDGQRHLERYDLVDCSPDLLEVAKERLGDASEGVEFGVLEMDRSPGDQGFEEGSYDIVIANNLAVDGGCIDDSLRNARTLLKPGGKFILLETTRDVPHHHMVLGALFEAWWTRAGEGRVGTPILSEEEWIARLCKAGFQEAEPWFEDYSETSGGALSVLVARAPPSSNNPRNVPTSLQMIMANPEEEHITGEIQQQLPLMNVTSHLLTAPRVGDSKQEGCMDVILPSVTRLLGSNPDEASWVAFKSRIMHSSAVLFVSSGSRGNLDDTDGAIWTGLARCLRLEHPGIRLVTLHLDVGDDDSENAAVTVRARLSRALATLLSGPTFDLGVDADEVENEFVQRDGQLFVPRVVPRTSIGDSVTRMHDQTTPEMAPFLDPNHCRTMAVELGTPGLLESLRWKNDTAASTVGPDDVRLELRAASINFKDVLIAAGQLDGITEMRNDCSGVVIEVGENMRRRFSPGDRVCALYSRSYTNYPVVHGDCCHVVPESVPWDVAASLPIVWCTVYYSLVYMGRLASGDSVLIHSAAGAVGQAAIMLAQHLGAEVFATVGTDAKADLIHQKFGIPHDHIFRSRSTMFHGAIMKMTGGRGVDVVLNSLSGEMFRLSCDTVAPFGRFVEIGRKDLMDDALMPMSFLLKNVTFSYVDLAHMIDTRKPLAHRLLRDVVQLVAQGAVDPAASITTMPISEIEAAFRLIQAGKHTGKLILTVEKDQHVKALPIATTVVTLDPDATYAVVGGFGGLGRAVIAWMAKRGARNVLVLSRSGAKDAQSKEFIAEMGVTGVNVVPGKCDVSRLNDVAAVIQRARLDGLPPIRGLIQSAMAIHDSLFESMSATQWKQALAPKTHGTRNLHLALSSSPLDFFIILSSAVAVRGNMGQANYAAACAVQDAIATHRAHSGASALSINIGAVSDVGFVAENPEVAASLQRQGLGSVSAAELLVLLDVAVASKGQNIIHEDPVVAIGLVPSTKNGGLGVKDKRFAHLYNGQSGGVGSSGGNGDIASLVNSAEDKVEAICHVIIGQLGKLIATPVESLSPERSLDSYGVDSLVAVELRNWIAATLRANVPLMVLRGTGSISELAGIVTRESRLVEG